MSLSIPFQITDWSSVPEIVVQGAKGNARTRTVEFPDNSTEGQVLRIRMVEYSAGYEADHWCEIGHLVFVLEGDLINELKNSTISVLGPGTSFAVSDGLSIHRVRTVGPVKVLVVDGAFLKQ
jgi:hypothetical protein